MSKFTIRTLNKLHNIQSPLLCEKRPVGDDRRMVWTLLSCFNINFVRSVLRSRPFFERFAVLSAQQRICIRRSFQSPIVCSLMNFELPKQASFFPMSLFKHFHVSYLVNPDEILSFSRKQDHAAVCLFADYPVG